jgi:hypothetical protein
MPSPTLDVSDPIIATTAEVTPIENSSDSLWSPSFRGAQEDGFLGSSFPSGLADISAVIFIIPCSLLYSDSLRGLGCRRSSQ